MSFKRPIVFILFLCVFSPCYFRSETVDGIVAVVDDEVITLTDLQIVKMFGLIDKQMQSEESSWIWVLQRWIDQKLVIKMTGKEISVRKDEIDNHLRKIKERLGPLEFNRHLEYFDLNEEELVQYLEEKILYQEIIQERFRREVLVSLKEIQSYYEEIYVPFQKANGGTPLPMVEMLTEIEAAIKREKTKNQVEEWIVRLRQEAEIRIFKDKYPEYFKE